MGNKPKTEKVLNLPQVKPEQKIKMSENQLAMFQHINYGVPAYSYQQQQQQTQQQKQMAPQVPVKFQPQPQVKVPVQAAQKLMQPRVNQIDQAMFYHHQEPEILMPQRNQARVQPQVQQRPQVQTQAQQNYGGYDYNNYYYNNNNNNGGYYTNNNSSYGYSNNNTNTNTKNYGYDYGYNYDYGYDYNNYNFQESTRFPTQMTTAPKKTSSTSQRVENIGAYVKEQIAKSHNELCDCYNCFKLSQEIEHQKKLQMHHLNQIKKREQELALSYGRQYQQNYGY